MRVYASIGGGTPSRVPGPADLTERCSGDTIHIMGLADSEEYARWASALGRAALRGANVVGAR